MDDPSEHVSPDWAPTSLLQITTAHSTTTANPATRALLDFQKAIIDSQD